MICQYGNLPATAVGSFIADGAQCWIDYYPILKYDPGMFSIQCLWIMRFSSLAEGNMHNIAEQCKM